MKKPIAKGQLTFQVSWFSLNLIRLRPGEVRLISRNQAHLFHNPRTPVRDDYLREANKLVPDPNILVNLVSRRVKQLKFGQKPLIESLERLDPEDIALKEIIEGKISYELSE